MNLVNLIEKAETEWENKPHGICPLCGCEFVLEDDGSLPFHETLCETVRELEKKKESVK